MSKPLPQYPADGNYLTGSNDSFYKALAELHAGTIELQRREIRRLKRQVSAIKSDALEMARYYSKGGTFPCRGVKSSEFITKYGRADAR